MKSDLFTLVGYNFVRKNFKIKNQMTVGKRFSRATKWDHPRFFIFFGLEVTAFPRYTTVWWLLDLGNSDLFTLVGFSLRTCGRFWHPFDQTQNPVPLLNILSMGVDWDSWGELGQMGRIGTPFLSSIRRDILFVFGIVPIPSACPNSPCLSQFTPVDSNL